MWTHAWGWVLLLQLSLLLSCRPVNAFESTPVCLIKPVPGRSGLEVSQEGINYLQSIDTAVAPIVVIGPYRSGKSFLLNQLLKVPCDKGFGVGHTRDTQTKGIWVWGQPNVVTAPDGTKLSLLFFDTEGFESTGKSNVYDDRIFALSAIMSSLLIYNLPETIRESDVEKLSFAVELAQGFYNRVEGRSQGGSLDPGAMLWLIQRDFLEGKSAEQLVKDALAPMPNPHHDKDLDQLNRIRLSLRTIAANSSGFGLVQPHLERTRLCSLDDSVLEPKYIQQREQLQSLVVKLAQAKKAGGQSYTGPQLANLVQRMVVALNAQDIPNAGSLLEAFNGQLLDKALRLYQQQLELLVLPVDEDVLEDKNIEGRTMALQLFTEQVLGVGAAGAALRERLLQKMKREHGLKVTANIAESDKVCGVSELNCETEIESAAASNVPSVRQFEETLHRCRTIFEATCKGPAKSVMSTRLGKAATNTRKNFMREYNDRLFSGLLIIALVIVVAFRFVFTIPILEGLGWLLLAFLELYPRLYGGSQTMYHSSWWRALTQVWEVLMFIVFLFPGAPMVWVVLLVGAYVQHRRRRGKRRRKGPPKAEERDLDV